MNRSEPSGYRPPKLSTFADLARSGLTHDDIARRINRGELRRLRSGVYAHVADDDSAGHDGDRLPAYEVARRGFLERTLAAARSVEPETVISHGSALALYGLPLYEVPLRLPTATRHRDGRGGGRRSSALICANLPLDGATGMVDGIPVTSPARTIIDVARTVSLESGVCAADEAVRRELCTTRDLQLEAEAARGRTGAARARALPALCSGLSESVLESLIRLILVLGGLPAPELQAWFGARRGERFRVDFYWPAWRLIGEADGFGKYGTHPEEIRENWAKERRRQQQLEEQGYIVIRWSWQDLRHPQRILERVAVEMRRQESLGFGPAV